MALGEPFYFVICIVTSFLAVSLGIILTVFKSRHNIANIYLGLLMFCYATFFVPGLFEAIGILDKMTWIIRTNFLLGTFVGPFTYLYCKSSIQEETLSLKDQWFHYLPFLFSLYFFIPTATATPEQKLGFYHDLVSTGLSPEPAWIVMAVLLHVLVYRLMAVIMVHRYYRHLVNSQSSIDASFHRWLLFLSIALLVPVISSSVLTVTSTKILPVFVGLIALSLFIFIVHFTFIISPKFFHRFPVVVPVPEMAGQILTKYKGSNLQEHHKERIASKLLDHMKIQKPYLNTDLNISELAKQIDIPSHQLSQIINERLGRNFMEFINGYRINEAKAKLSEDRNQKYTILTIAEDSGFNSKSAFYASFKKNVGCTPSQYRRGVAEEV